MSAETSTKTVMQKIIRNYYGFQIFFSLLIWMPVFYEYQIRIGLSAAEIFQIQSIYYLAFCLLEIPTGILADRIGYRKCMIAGSIVLIASNLAAIYVQNFTGMTMHFMLIALSRSLISGASSAYLYDSLAFHERTPDYKGIEGRARAYGLVAKIVSWIGIGSLMNLWLTSPYWLTGLAAVISLGFAVNLPKLDFLIPQASTKVLKTIPTVQQLLHALKTMWTKPMLLLVIIQGIGLFVLGRIVQVNLFQPILSAKGFAVTSFGGIMSLMTVFEAIGSGYPEFLRRWMGDLAAVFVLTILMAISLFLMTPSTSVICLAALCLFSLTAGLSFPIQKQLMNDVIPRGGNSGRATILSIESIFDRASCAVVAALLGSELMDPKSLATFLNFSGLVTILGVAALYLLMRKLSPKARS